MKLYFSLPNFYENFYFNKTFESIIIFHPDWLIKPDIKINFLTGSFPFHSWSGGFNNCQFQNYSNIYYDIIKCNNETRRPFCINCSNILLDKNDYLDTFSHCILSLCENGSNLIEISDLNLYEILKEKYPLYNFILSKEIYFLNPNNYNSNLINSIIKTE